MTSAHVLTISALLIACCEKLQSKTGSRIRDHTLANWIFVYRHILSDQCPVLVSKLFVTIESQISQQYSLCDPETLILLFI